MIIFNGSVHHAFSHLIDLPRSRSFLIGQNKLNDSSDASKRHFHWLIYNFLQSLFDIDPIKGRDTIAHDDDDDDDTPIYKSPK